MIQPVTRAGPLACAPTGIPPMTLAIEKIGDVLLVKPAGQIHSANAAEIEAQLNAQVQAGEHKVLIDMSDLAFISSAGLRVLLVLAKRLKQEGGKLVLCALNPQVLEVMEISGFLSILTTVGTRDEALARLA